MHLTVGRASKGEREAIKISDAAEFFFSLTPNSHSLTELSLPSSPKLFVYCPFPAAWVDMGLGLGARAPQTCCFDDKRRAKNHATRSSTRRKSLRRQQDSRVCHPYDLTGHRRHRPRTSQTEGTMAPCECEVAEFIDWISVGRRSDIHPSPSDSAAG